MKAGRACSEGCGSQFNIITCISDSSSVVVSRSCRKGRVENTSTKSVHWCVLRIRCLAMGVVYRVITLQRVYMLQYNQLTLGNLAEVVTLFVPATTRNLRCKNRKWSLQCLCHHIVSRTRTGLHL
jgi:hypothetical protein